MLLALLPVTLAQDLSLLCGTADLTVERISLSEVGFSPASPERAALGPELYAIGPSGEAGLYDPVRREALIVTAGELRRIEVGRVDDLAFSEAGGLLALDESRRVLELWSAEGERLDALPMPELIPPGCTLWVRGGEIRARDLFGNLHRLARTDGEALEPGEGPRLIEVAAPLSWSGEEQALSWEGGRLDLPEAVKASGIWLSEGGWLMVDQVVGEHPIEVRRQLFLSGTDLSLEVPLEGPWRPGRAAAASGGELLLLLPGEDALELVRVRP